MKRKAVALIDEPRCIGCTLCIEACPVDAIAGARGFLHTVIADYCIGCELCVAPCPVDCIAMVPAPRPWTAADAKGAQGRSRTRRKRLSIKNTSRTSVERRAIVAALLKK